MAGYDLPVRAIRQQVASALDLIIQIERMHRRQPAQSPPITEVQRMESDVITLQDIYDFKIEDAGPGAPSSAACATRACGRRSCRQVRASRHRAAAR